jgi:hypothetical protein
MKHADFELHPFTHVPSGAQVVLTGNIRRDGEMLRLSYRLQGNLKALSIPAADPPPQRRHELWKGTCFECFIQPDGSTAYWELNLSPTGHWNLYRFEKYRQGMREEPALVEMKIEVKSDSKRLDLRAELDLNALGVGPVPSRIGLSAVLAPLSGALEYWALAHPGAKPDFHLPESFLLEL